MVADWIPEDVPTKLTRIWKGQPLRVVDLFSGCGGMSLGLQRAGFQILGGIELNPRASATYATNLFHSAGEEGRALHAIPHDITSYSPEQFLHEVLKSDSPHGLVDVIAGGPPCQAFSRIGRAKLRAVRNNPEAFRADERSSLYVHYLEYVEYFRPLAVLMENVPDIMNYGGQNIAEEIAASLEDLGYHCQYTILNTVHYGVPQFRQRFYLIAFLKELASEPSFPAGTHLPEIMPPGYESAHSVALKTIHVALKIVQPGLFGIPHYVPSPQPAGSSLLKAISTSQALGDLPPLRFHLRMKPRTGRRSFDTCLPYIDTEPSAYAREMREWPGYEESNGVIDHVIRYLPRDYPIFRLMKHDDQYPQAHEIAQKLFQARLKKYQQKYQRVLEQDAEEYQELLKKTVPPYDPSKFPNKWWKLHPDRPSRTLTAHMGKDTYSHIHYDSYQGRVISVREAARLQSFPDGFVFASAMNAAYTMIGNAVAPRMAFVLGEHVSRLLRDSAEQWKHLSQVHLAIQPASSQPVPAGTGDPASSGGEGA